MADHDPAVPETTEGAPLQRSEAIESRFLFVDVAAQRAKQLRRGARPRLGTPDVETSAGWRPDQPHKLERIAMEEVKQRLVLYTLPDAPSTRAQNAG
ncbi:MAG: DNA-directed RNA polymerase subunit omega [Acidobacteriota bacterium]|nr:DNA-directed RNA polymerase subunit omega [Acidobacteriota bacterium]